MNHESKQRELIELRLRVQQLEEELAQEGNVKEWPPQGYYTIYHVLAGFVLGIYGAVASLLFNIIGSLVVGQHPLQLIRVYLTFPLGKEALTMDSGVILAIGCCLYLGTGMVLGIPFHLVLTRCLPRASFGVRWFAVTLMALAIWVVNYYVILSWLQPLLFDGSWIVDLIPWWVAALTHLIFGWTLLLVQPLGTFLPYGPKTEDR